MMKIRAPQVIVAFISIVVLALFAFYFYGLDYLCGMQRGYLCPGYLCSKKNEALYGPELTAKVNELVLLLKKYRCPDLASCWNGYTEAVKSSHEYLSGGPWLPEFVVGGAGCYVFYRQEGLDAINKLSAEINASLKVRGIDPATSALCWVGPRYWACDCLI
jgi:hypothetical protein